MTTWAYWVVVPRMKSEPAEPVWPPGEVEITPGASFKASRNCRMPWLVSAAGSNTVTAEVTVVGSRGTCNAETISGSRSVVDWGLSGSAAWAGSWTSRASSAMALRREPLGGVG